MEEYLLVSGMRNNKYMSGDKDSELFKKFKEFLSKEPSMEEPHANMKKEEHSTRHTYNNPKLDNSHFSISEAEEIVSNMYHLDGSKKLVGEKYTMMKAKEVCERYRGMIPTNVNYLDIYVAINAQYHDYSRVFKSWFGENIDSKIIESAIVFWFKDDDYPEGNKLKAYFYNM